MWTELNLYYRSHLNTQVIVYITGKEENNPYIYHIFGETKLNTDVNWHWIYETWTPNIDNNPTYGITDVLHMNNDRIIFYNNLNTSLVNLHNTILFRIPYIKQKLKVIHGNLQTRRWYTGEINPGRYSLIDNGN